MQIYTKNSYNAIFIQPTTACAWYCGGCYLKTFEKKQNIVKDLPVPSWMAEVTKEILSGKRIKCNQLSISLNNLKRQGPIMMSDQAGRHITTTDGVTNDFGMHKYIENIYKFTTIKNCELHYTVSMNAVRDYNRVWDFISASADNVTVSIDDFKWGKNYEYLMETHDFNKEVNKFNLNCNLLFSPGVIKALRKSNHLAFERLLDIFDTIYLVAYKPDLRGPYTKIHIESIRELIALYNSLDSSVKEKKVFIDGCVNACVSKHGCTAGINLMTIWPDGSLIGCPYSSKPIARPCELTPDNIIDNMITLRNHIRKKDIYEYNKCEMRNLWPDQK